MIVPNSTIYLLKTPFEMSDINQLTFSGREAQEEYFLSLPKLELENATYQRKDGVIRYPAYMDEIIEYNYCMYQNTNYNNKWFYAYIDKIKYINDGMTEISIITDVFQTWQFDFVYKQMYIEREHTNNDSIGANTILEGLDIGDYIYNGDRVNLTYDAIPYDYIGFACSDLPDTVKEDWGLSSRATSRIFQGFYYVAAYGSTIANAFISYMNSNNMFNAIQNIFMLPSSLYGVSGLTTSHTYQTSGGSNFSIDLFNGSTYVSIPYSYSAYNVSTPTSLNSYVPKNNKLLVYPYSLFVVSNNQGATQEYRFEDFSNGSFDINMSITGGGVDIRMIPRHYKGIDKNNLFGINGAKFPTCSWTGDYYVNWLAQNAVNLKYQNLHRGITGVLGVGSTLLTGDITGVIGAAGNIVDSIIDTQQQKENAQIQPDIAGGNVNSGDVTYAMGEMNFSIYKLCPKQEYITSIDNFFSMFGYKTNKVKLPNITGRTNWNYVKVINANIIGNMPQEDLQQMRVILQNGVTFWHNPATFLDYSQSNTIVT